MFQLIIRLPVPCDDSDIGRSCHPSCIGTLLDNILEVQPAEEPEGGAELLFVFPWASCAASDEFGYEYRCQWALSTWIAVRDVT